MVTARSHSPYVRRAIVSHLQGGPIARVTGPNPEPNIVWPFARVDIPDEAALNASNMLGSRPTVHVHVFAKGDDESACADLAAWVVGRLDASGLTLDTPYPASIKRMAWLRTQMLRDTAQAQAWHAFIQFDCAVSSELI